MQGSVTGFYPYPFVNISKLGFTTVALNGVGIVSLLLAVGVLYLLLDKLMARRQIIRQVDSPSRSRSLT